MAYYIDGNNYFKRLQPAKTEELINLVQVPVSPLTIQDEDDRAYVGDAIVFSALEAKTIEITYSNIPMKNMSAKAYLTDAEGELIIDETNGEITNDQLVIYPSTYYAWGASLTITNSEASEQNVVVVAAGYHLKDVGKEIIETEDAEGVVENGVLKYKLKKNHLIQTRALGEDIANTLLTSFSIVRKDVTLDYRGNLCLRLMDEIETIEYNKDGIFSTGEFYLYKIVTHYDGTVKQDLNGRKIE